MGPSTGIESEYLASLNLRSAAKDQQESVKMFALIPTCDRDAAAQTLSKEDIKKQETEVHRAYIGVIVTVRMLKMYSMRGGEVDVLCSDGKVYSMPVIMLCLALDHEETELHCLKAANGCLSFDCPKNEFASWSSRPGAPKLVEADIQKIDEAAAELLEADGSIKRG